MKQISAEWLADTYSMTALKQGIILLRSINGQVYWAIGMGASALSYILVSLLGKRAIYNMDKMLNRGVYAIKGEMEIVSEIPERGWKMLGMGKEFTRGDKFIYIVNYVWTLSWTILFIVGTVYNLYNLSLIHI